MFFLWLLNRVNISLKIFSTPQEGFYLIRDNTSQISCNKEIFTQEFYL